MLEKNKLKKFWTKRYGHIRFRLMEFTTTGYLAVIGILLIFFHENIPNWPLYSIGHGLFIIFILEIVRIGEKHPGKKLFWILRTFYPAGVMLLGWSELGALVRMIFGDYWSTNLIINMDKSIFGVHPTVWVQQFYRPWLDELMNIFYSGYYLFFPSLVLILYIRGKKQETMAAFSLLTFAMFTNFILFYIFPTLSPAMEKSLQVLHSEKWTGYAVAKLTRFIQANMAEGGGTFPSSHITVAVVASLIALRYEKILGYVFIIMTLGVVVSTVYLGYHHAVDPICGLIWGAICYPLGLLWIKSRGEDPKTNFQKK
ncbi:MAG: phosphatase PAP2 family protein [Candidatus Aminicenantes bacterium]|nr:phosphatase PAP2 family protein [Candidatus Aminicenantes bacterium]